MSSGWLRDSDVAAPLPFGWKLCLSVVPKTICLTESAEFEALALELALALAVAELGLELGRELELELEPEHPAVLSSPAATTATPRRVAIRTLKVFINRFVRDPGDAWRSGVKRPGERSMATRRPNSTHLINTCRDALCPVAFLLRAHLLEHVLRDLPAAGGHCRAGRPIAPGSCAGRGRR